MTPVTAVGKFLVALTGVSKLAVSVLLFRASFMELGPGAEKLRRAFLFGAFLFVGDGVLFLLIAFDAERIAQLAWLGVVATFALALAMIVWMRRHETRRALRAGASRG